jgi:hypothetical protein
LTQTKPLCVDVGERGRDEFDGLVLVDDAPRLGEDAGDLDVGGEHLAVAVENVGPRGGHRVGCGAAYRIRHVRLHPEVDQLGDEHGKEQHEHQSDDAEAAAAFVEPRREEILDHPHDAPTLAHGGID